jgi:NADPH:quinone reductase-like Zn-dependent oxidoreductase
MNEDSRTMMEEASGVRAIVHDRYGPVDTLEQRELPVPEIGEREVLVRVRAAALHIGDSFAVQGRPFPVRAFSGLRRPKYGVPGLDVAGVVEAVGAEVTRFRPGDEVFGCGAGTCAELVRSREEELVPKPADLSDEQAAAIPTSALAALHGLRAGRLAPGQHVLVVGASGGVGTFAIQIAKALGAASVTAVCSARNADLVRSLGADEVIDYATRDFTRGGRQYDLILDNVENRSLGEVRRALTPNGTIVLNSGTGAAGIGLFVRLLRPILVSPFVRHRLVRFLSNPNADDLALLATLVEEGKLRPVIDRTYRLSETASALRHIETGHARGKVVVAI